MKIFTEQIEQIIANRAGHRTAEKYFEGDVARLAFSESFRRELHGKVQSMRLNHARTVVSALVNRLEINSITGKTDKANKAIDKVLKQNGKGAFFNDLFTKASVYGEAFAMAWPDAKGDWKLSAYDPKSTFIKYSDENPWQKEYALRIFSSNGKTRLNAFYADRIVKYVANSDTLDMALDWSVVETVENPYGEIPIFHLRNNSQHGRPEHFDAYNSQDAINELVSTHMETIQYQGAPQRYALANIEQSGEPQDFGDGASDRENLEALKNGPGELWYLKGVTNVGTFEPAKPETFWTPIKDQIVTMASLTDTPLHVFTGQVLSGPALRAAESPLIKKVERRQDQYTNAIEELFAYILGVDNINANITIIWNDGQSVDMLEEWDILAKKRNVGMPFQQVLIEAGYSETSIAKIMAWKAENDEKDYARAANTNPDVRVQEQNDETKIDTGEIK